MIVRYSFIDTAPVEWIDKKRSRLAWWPRGVLFVTLMGLVYVLILQTRLSAAQDNGYSLRFYGHGLGDIDRVRIPIDPPVPADLGATDFTIEWWMKATLEQNGSPSCTPGGDNWIYGNIVFDRDIWGPGDYGDYGVSLTGGRIAFGANNGDSGETLCGSVLVADGNWHHVAVTRRLSDGLLRIFVDGQLDGQVDGPDGDVSYRDGRPTWYDDDPFLVIGAEKHDAGPEYPSYTGWIDEVRLSGIVRYTSAFEPPSAPFTTDGNTVALYHLDEGPAGACTGTVLDSSGASGGPSHGSCHYGGADPAGPVYTTDIPFAQDTTPPFISNVAASAQATEAVITWDTDEPATSQVTYGISPTLNLSTTESTEYVISHEVVLASLSPDTVYAYAVRSTDEAGNPAVSAVFSFRTQDTTPPSISNVAASALATEAVITWDTDEPATSQVTYGISPTLNLSTTESTEYVISHEVVLASLSPDTVYAYAVRSTDEAGNPAVSAVFDFKTLASEDANYVYLPFVLMSSGFTDTRAHLCQHLAVGLASSAVLASVVIVSARREAQARRSQGESSTKDNSRVSARGPT